MIVSQLVIPTTKRSLQVYTKSLAVAANTSSHGVGFRRMQSTLSSVQTLLSELRQLDTSSLCDAEKTIASNDDGETGIRLMNTTIRPMNHLVDSTRGAVMAGIARTVSFTQPNDFLPVMRALALEAQADEVLVVNTLSSTRAVAGEIFVAEARRKGLAGIVIDGPIRDTAHLEDKSEEPTAPMRMYATSITPYSGTTQSPGEMQAPVVNCGGLEVRPGDIVVGDDDGVLVGTVDTFATLVPIAKQIQDIELKLMDEISGNNNLASMTNLEEHIAQRLEGKDSNLEFRI
eukprot:CAMPEP_0116114888 /NCGR_PEP_ID=MMETSP0329-20121206/214_1 /TAXON_ID=697910 /ORGANISM="Pseudo-nitzschia arenysensis, Strain B593" /LENGTH=287 /DNA_ID=CAMNT_0003608285 /DNA_START=71 /DNA_END=934 /DNA_ORIENTATION=-